MNELRVYVPRPGSRLEDRILPASALVGAPTEERTIILYFEGNRYNSEAMSHFDRKLLHAADRLIAKYPTIARTLGDISDLVPVGWYDGDTHQFELEDRASLEEWLGHPYVPQEMTR